MNRWRRLIEQEGHARHGLARAAALVSTEREAEVALVSAGYTATEVDRLIANVEPYLPEEWERDRLRTILDSITFLDEGYGVSSKRIEMALRLDGIAGVNHDKLRDALGFSDAKSIGHVLRTLRGKVIDGRMLTTTDIGDPVKWSVARVRPIEGASPRATLDGARAVLAGIDRGRVRADGCHVFVRPFESDEGRRTRARRRVESRPWLDAAIFGFRDYPRTLTGYLSASERHVGARVVASMSGAEANASAWAKAWPSGAHALLAPNPRFARIVAARLASGRAHS